MRQSIILENSPCPSPSSSPSPIPRSITNSSPSLSPSIRIASTNDKELKSNIEELLAKERQQTSDNIVNNTNNTNNNNNNENNLNNNHPLCAIQKESVQLSKNLNSTLSRSTKKPSPTQAGLAKLIKLPEFEKFPVERANKNEFDPKTSKWKTSKVYVKIDPEFFAKGSMRMAFHMQILIEKNNELIPLQEKYVAKMSIKYHNRLSQMYTMYNPDNLSLPDIDELDDREKCYQDVQLQLYAKRWADLYNSYEPPKRVDFLNCFCLDMTDRPGCPTCCVEPYIEGAYKKHNNNFGYVSRDDVRNTPQAFSHFTYHASNQTILICDIQGVEDNYTDPLMHSTLFDDFGRGNLGADGMRKFLSTHTCNPICNYLRLPQVSPPSEGGTVPARKAARIPPRPPASLDFGDYYLMSKPPQILDPSCPCTIS